MQSVPNPYLVDTSSLQTEGGFDWLWWWRRRPAPPAPAETPATPRPPETPATPLPPETPAPPAPKTYEEGRNMCKKHQAVQEFLEEQCIVTRLICTFIDWSLANIKPKSQSQRIFSLSR